MFEHSSNLCLIGFAGRTLFVSALFLLGMGGAEEKEFHFKSTFDGSDQVAVSYVPALPGTTARPLLVVAHYWGGSRFTAAKQGYYVECDHRGWLLVCPEMHGKRTPGSSSLASLQSQHDIVDAVSYMRQHHRVDTTRIYLAGRSMGGQAAQIMAAKHPDLFAAVVAGQGICDVELWVQQSPWYKEEIEKECGPLVPQNRFEYQRRSSIHYASNLQYLPVILWHGTNDHLVPSSQSQKLYAAMRKHNPFHAPVKWLVGSSHGSANCTVDWICDQLQFYQNVSDQILRVSGRFYGNLNLVTDEEKDFFWLRIKPDDLGQFARVKADVTTDTLRVKAENVAAFTLISAKLAKTVSLKRYHISSDGKTVLLVKQKGKARKIASVKGKGQGALVLGE